MCDFALVDVQCTCYRLVDASLSIPFVLHSVVVESYVCMPNGKQITKKNHTIDSFFLVQIEILGIIVGMIEAYLLPADKSVLAQTGSDKMFFVRIVVWLVICLVWIFNN